MPSFSHAQLSITGYTDAWTWHEAALASLGEISASTRSACTRARRSPTCAWRSSTATGPATWAAAFLVYFDGAGSYVYAKEVDLYVLYPGRA